MNATREQLKAALLALDPGDLDEILRGFANLRTSEVSSVQPEGTPVMKDGKLENFMLKIGGKSYRCKCGCNVFHKPDDRRPDIYRCNSCDDTFETE
jgi:hypothetical protein